MPTDFSDRPVTRDQVELAAKQYLHAHEPGAEIIMKHPDGTGKNEISLSVEGNDAIQSLILSLAFVVAEENMVVLDGEAMVDRQAIMDTFYGYAMYIHASEDRPGFFTVTLPFEPDLFTALMNDPTLGLID